MRFTLATLPSGIVGRMTVLTVKQSWAELFISGFKDVENRSRRTTFRGRFAVHAGLRRADFEDPDPNAMPKRLRKPIEQAWSGTPIRAEVIDTVELIDCIEDRRSPCD